MMRGRRLVVVILAFGLVVSTVPGGAVVNAVDPGIPTASGASDVMGEERVGAPVAQTDAVNTSEDNGTSQAPVGQQLGTVIAVTTDEVGSDVAASSLDTGLENANDSERAYLLADRAATLRDQANRILTDQRAARAAYEDGELTRTEFARRLAVLTGQARTVDRNFERLNERATDLSALELRTAGYDRGANGEARERLDRVMGSGTSALLAQYTGVESGEFSLEVNGGVSIKVESDDGERSRELKREQPGDGRFEVTQREALVAATEPLSADREGEWRLQAIDRDEDDGYYGFEFGFFGPKAIGEAEVTVDGQTGAVFEFEEELETRDNDNTEAPLSVTIIDGTAEAGTTVTLRVTAGGEPIEDATVELDDQAIGETDSDGRIALILPDDDEVDIEVEAGGREGELEITLEPDSERDGDEEIRQQLSASGTIDNEMVTLSVTYDGEGVSSATVYADDEPVGTTDANGSISFATPETDDKLDITVVKGGFEAELEFKIDSDGELSLEDVSLDERDDEDEETDNEEADEDEETDNKEADDEELSVVVDSGEPEPGATVTLEVSDEDGDPVERATVELDDQRAGETDADGQITVTLPDDDEVDIEVEAGDSEGTLDLEFDDG